MNCKNCGNELSFESNYCYQCGSKVVKKRLHLKGVLAEWFSTVFNFDNKLLVTYLHLFSKPQNVIVGYIEGLRKKYMSPVSFYLLAFGVYGFYTVIFDIREFHSDFLTGFYEYDGKGEDLSLSEEKLRRLNILNLPIYFSQILIFALSFKLIFSKRYNYTENLIVAFYWFGQFILTMTTFSFILYFLGIELNEFITSGMAVSLCLYTLWIHKIIFPNKWFKQIIQFIGFMFLSFILYIIFILLVSVLI